MYVELRNYIARRGQLTEEQLRTIESFFEPRSIRKGEFVQRAGEVARIGGFVIQGCLRTYVIDDRGKEHIVQFLPEDYWFSDLQSARSQTPSPYFIDAIEPTIILVSDFPSFVEMFAQVPEFGAMYRTGLEKAIAVRENRIVSTLRSSGQERYREFVARYPSLANRVPLHMLASYLGLTPETLSRIRSRRHE